MTVVSVPCEVIRTHPSACVRSLEQWVMAMVEGQSSALFSTWGAPAISLGDMRLCGGVDDFYFFLIFYFAVSEGKKQLPFTVLHLKSKTMISTFAIYKSWERKEKGRSPLFPPSKY